MPLDNGAKTKAIHPEAKRLLVLFVYAVMFLGLLLPEAEDPIIVWATMWATLVPLWFGPLALLVPSCGRRWYDPAVLFNLMMFYYTAKGASLAFDTSIAYVEGMNSEAIRIDYLFAAFSVITGMLAWNLGYQVMWTRCGRVQGQPGDIATGGELMPWWRGPVCLLSVAGIVCFALFFQSTGQSILGFLVNPLLRSYLTDGALGVQAPLANFWKLGAYLWPLGSLVWVAQLGWTGARRPALLWLHVALGAAMYFLIGGRIDLLGLLLGILLIYNVLIKATSPWVFGGVGGAGLAYSYLINLWRHIGGQEVGDDFGSRVQVLGDTQFSLKDLADLLAGQSLSDIRLFVKIISVYGQERSLEYGETFTRVVTQFVPRSLWPGKPLDLSVEVNALYGTGMAGTPPGFFGEMFMNFHLPGVIIGGALLGVTFAWLYSRWALSSRGPFDIAKYALFAPVVVMLPSATFANVVSGAGVPILALIILERRFGRGGRKSVEIR